MATPRVSAPPARSKKPPTAGKLKVVPSRKDKSKRVDPIDMPLLNDRFPAEDMRSLPFVRELAGNESAAHMKLYGAGRDFWSVPPSVDYLHDCEVGTCFGAAYLIHLAAAQGNGLNLGWIVEQMKGSEVRGFKVGFLFAVELYARSLAVNVGRQRIESEHRARMAKGRALMTRKTAKCG